MAFKLDRLSAYTFIVQASRAPSSAFIALWEKMCRKIETQENGQDALNAAIVQALNAAGIAVQAANTAQQAANAAQSAADSAGGGTEKSGSATNPSITVSSTVSWTAGPIVSLTGVAAGDLTITGTGPQQDDNVTLTITNINQVSFVGEFRVVEVIGGVDGTVFGPFSMTASVAADPEAPGVYPALVFNTDIAAVSAVLSARVSTGAVDYRIDFRKTSGPTINSLLGYIYARRA